MNIFYLSHNPKICSEYHCDKHCVKMILEYCQILSTTHRILDGCLYILPDNREYLLYKATHMNHPSVIWARESDKNYLWLLDLLVELSKEYTFRYEKVHKCERIGLIDMLYNLPNNIPVSDFTPPTLVMPDKYKISNDAIKSYQNYYIHEKIKIHKWKNRSIPDFILNDVKS